MIRRYIAVLALLLTSGCGGGSISSTSAPAIAQPLGTVDRLIKTGDSWSFYVSGTVTSSGKSETYSGNAVWTATNIGVGVVKYPTIKQNITMHTRGGAVRKVENHVYFSQEGKTRKTTIYGFKKDGIVRMYLTPDSHRFDTMTPGATLTYTLPYPDGTADTVTRTLIGVEEVNVPSGRFLAYRIVETIDRPDRLITTTLWYAKQLGTFVRSEEQNVFKDGSFSETRTLKLGSYWFISEAPLAE